MPIRWRGGSTPPSSYSTADWMSSRQRAIWPVVTACQNAKLADMWSEPEMTVLFEVPRATIVFTVKLPAGLARRVRRVAGSSGQSISALVAAALVEFLDRHHGGGRG